MIPQTDLDAIREAFPAILEHYDINPNRDFKIPWRDDTSPSGHYSQESGLVTDFGKDERYNVFDFVGMMEGLNDFKEQAQAAADFIGLQLGNEGSSTPTSHRPKATRPRFELPPKAGFEPWPIEEFQFARGELFKNEAALSYLFSRGFDRQKIWRNHLGWIPNRKAIVNDDDSLMFTKQEPNAPHGFIVIPFMNREATAADYCMLRVIPGDEPPMNKELRPTGYVSPLFREWLLSARKSVVYVTEGLLDCLAMEMLIGKPCIALGGANFTKRFASVLYATPQQLRPQKIVLALDADAPGRKAALKIAADLDALGIPHANFDMPSGCKDPNDILIQLAGGERD